MKYRTKIKLKILDIKGNGIHVFVNAKINKHKCLLLIDTGASKSVFDKSSIESNLINSKIDKSDELSVGLGTDSMESMTSCFKSFEIGKLKIKNFDTVILDLKHINQSYESLGMSEIFGVIGSDFLKKYNAIINYKDKSLRLDLK